MIPEVNIPEPQPADRAPDPVGVPRRRLREYLALYFGGWRCERMIFALILGLLLIALMGFIRPQDATGLDPDYFWYLKINWRAQADLVLTGDSRAYLGASPQAMRNVLAGRRILNFGFDNCGYSPEYLKAAERVLDPASPHRAIVLGITPHALTPQASQLNQFNIMRDQLAEYSATKLRVKLVLSRFFHRFCDPFPPERVLGMMGIGTVTHHRCEYFADGWMGSVLDPPRPRDALDNVPSRYDNNRISPRIVQDLLDAAARWSKAGIKVYAFRLPTNAEMVALEDKWAPFDERAFQARFEAVGGRWLAVDQNAYATYDGSHLYRDAALRLSRDLGLALAAREAGERGPAARKP